MSRSLLSLDCIIQFDKTPLNPPMALGFRADRCATSRTHTGTIALCFERDGMELDAPIATATGHQ